MMGGVGSLRLCSTASGAAATESVEFRLDRLDGDLTGVVVFRMNRPRAMNAISRSLLGSFYDAVEEVRFDRSARVIVLKSDVAGAFCAGADLKERAKMSPEEVPGFVSKARGLMAEFGALGQPVIAALDGVALGGGLEMALAADIRTASAEARLGLTETKLAIIPGAGGTQNLPRLVGKARAKELIFTGRIIDGSEAAALGIVNAVAPQNEAGDAAYQLALNMAKEILPNGPVALRAAKLAINQGMEMDLASGLQTEMLAYQMVVPTKDRLEGLKAFKEKRKPVYTGN